MMENYDSSNSTSVNDVGTYQVPMMFNYNTYNLLNQDDALIYNTTDFQGNPCTNANQGGWYTQYPSCNYSNDQYVPDGSIPIEVQNQEVVNNQYMGQMYTDPEQTNTYNNLEEYVSLDYIANYFPTPQPQAINNGAYLPQIPTPEGATSVTTEPSTSSEEIPKFVCFVCNKVFSKASYLNQHNSAQHDESKRFKCPRCGKKFNNALLCEKHAAKHTGDKEYKCTLCTKQYNFRSDLHRHMYTHSKGSCPYNCPVCGKGFVRRDHLNGHLRRRRSHCAKTV